MSLGIEEAHPLNATPSPGNQALISKALSPGRVAMGGGGTLRFPLSPLEFSSPKLFAVWRVGSLEKLLHNKKQSGKSRPNWALVEKIETSCQRAFSPRSHDVGIHVTPPLYVECHQPCQPVRWYSTY